MPRKSAGVLLYRRRKGRLEIFLAHHGGPFWQGKDLGAWTIPKGEIGPDEEPLDAARREFREETGFDVPGDLQAPSIPLTPVRQAGGKLVTAWAVEGDCDAAAIRSNFFSVQWPPKSGKRRRYPEIDRARWFPLETAKAKILPGQRPLLEELERLLAPDSAISDEPEPKARPETPADGPPSGRETA